ncbi:hypothetical protein FGO68_gene2539 [Halteria grandinella]|uniref:Uncharacterized protein n=1 Tax=Halteria grandinella TaxID=5974 RepID=A0A8J8NVJ8_HALGN|nr:hypothetical protein FGO68_gene2539 [Halteria grandinella]
MKSTLIVATYLIIMETLPISMDFLSYFSKPLLTVATEVNPELFRYYSLIVGALHTWDYSTDLVLFILSILLDMPLLNKMSLFYYLGSQEGKGIFGIFNRGHPIIKQIVFTQDGGMTKEILIIIYYTLEFFLQVLETCSDVLNIVLSPVLVLVNRTSAATMLTANGGSTSIIAKWLDFLTFFGQVSSILQALSASVVLAYIFLQNSLFSYPFDRSVMNLITALFSFTIPEILGQTMAVKSAIRFYESMVV